MKSDIEYLKEQMLSVFQGLQYFDPKEGMPLEITVKETSGGYSGGNCWDDTVAEYHSEPTQGVYLMMISPLMTAICEIFTQISYAQGFALQNKLQEIIQIGSDGESEYYGNSTEYDTYTLNTEEFFEACESLL